MYNHAPENYKNPFEVIVSGVGFEHIASNPEDIFYRDAVITAFVASKRWPNNPGNALIIPNVLFENLYDISDDALTHIHLFSKRLAIAMKKVYQCDGVSIRQHNEPAGDQEVWHYHLHVFPRYVGDELYKRSDEAYTSDPDERSEYASKLREYFNDKSV